MAKTHTDTQIEEHDYVALDRAVDEWLAGTRGTVVSVDPDEDAYTVEVMDEHGRTLDLVPCTRLDLILLAQASQSHSSNGRP